MLLGEETELTLQSQMELDSCNSLVFQGEAGVAQFSIASLLHFPVHLHISVLVHRGSPGMSCGSQLGDSNVSLAQTVQTNYLFIT